jgi:S-disulfanyl-L-cysteine oxidoreductase SoxD
MDLTILPDGKDLPAGRGTVAEGKAIYEAKCLACHGVGGQGQPMDRLTGGVGSLATPAPVKTVNSYWPFATSLFDYIRRAMPLTTPQTLRPNEVYALVAYILSIDGVVKADAVLDARNLPAVKMPNRDGFLNWWENPQR